MAIIRKDRGEEVDKAIFEFNNGDLQALKEIHEQWDFLNLESALRFALAVLKQTKTETVYIIDDSGAKIGLKPSISLKKEKNATTETNL